MAIGRLGCRLACTIACLATCGYALAATLEPVAGRTAPPLIARTLDGTPIRLDDFRGRTVLVNFWATWCAPCMEEMPSLAQLQRNFEGRIVVIPVSVDSEGDRTKAINELARLSGGSLPFLQDMTRGVLFDAQAAGMPVTIIYNTRGEEIARLAGGADWSSDEATRFINAVLTEQ